MATPIARLRALDTRVLDWTLAGAFVVGSAAEMAFFAADAADFAVGGLVAASMATLGVRRRRPLVPAAAIAATSLLSAFTAPFVIENLSAPYLALMVALYSLGRYEGRLAVPAVAAILGTVVIGTATTGDFDLGQVFWLGILGAGPFAIGRAVRGRTRLQAELRARTEELERDRERRAVRAVEDERARLATELQALIANGVSAMVVQAEVVPRAIDAGNVAGAERTLAAIETTGREALAETRRLLGVLRPGDERPSLVPQPSLAQLDGLAARLRGDGLEVDLTFEGDPVALSPGPELAAYRVVQDALEAAARGGAASARVVVRFEPPDLKLDVVDDRTATVDAAETVAAMRKRLGLYGGRVRAGDAGEGFRMLARMPLNGGAS